jgi:hypothetical protein
MDLAFVLLLLFGATTVALEASNILRSRRQRRARVAAAHLAEATARARGAVTPGPGTVVEAAEPFMVRPVQPRLVTGADAFDPDLAAARTVARRSGPRPVPAAAEESIEELAQRWAWVDDAHSGSDGPSLASA